MSSKTKSDPVDLSFWDERRGRIQTRIGGWVIGEAVYCQGYSMMDELLGEKSYFQVLILSVTGRMVERRLADWIEAYFLCLSYPDARIWCNQIGSLAGTLQASPVAAACAGALASDSRLYGSGTFPAGIALIQDALEKRRNGLTVEEIVRGYQRTPKSKPVMIGYSRPVASGDERIETMERVTAQHSFEIGEHLTLAYEIQDFLLKKTNEGMNALGYGCPFLCDQGFTPDEIYRIHALMVYSGVLACYAEAADNPPEAFFPLQCHDMDYQGPAPRPVPDIS